MHSLGSYDRQLSWYGLGCQSGRFAPHVHRKEALTVRQPCVGNRRRNIVTCCDDDLELDIKDVRGLDMMEVCIGRASISLPSDIPIVPKAVFGQPADTLSFDVVGVGLNDILTKGVGTRQTKDLYLPENSSVDPYVLSQPIFRGKQVILFSSGQDVLIEPLWWERHDSGLLTTLASMGFLAITGMNFSVFDGECAFAHALNIAKSLRYSERLDQLGAWSIPHIYAINIYQCQRWVNWLLANPKVKIVTINSQLQKSKFDLANLTATVQHLLTHTDVEIILQGMSRKLIRELTDDQAGRIHSAAVEPIKSALIRQDKISENHINVLIKQIKIPDRSCPRSQYVTLKIPKKV